MKRFWTRALSLCLLLAVMAGPVSAEEIAILAFEGSPEDAVNNLRDAIRKEALRTEGIELSDAGGDETLFDILEINMCDDDTSPDCLDLVFEHLGVNSYVYATVADNKAIVQWYAKGEGFKRGVDKAYNGKRSEAEDIAARLFGGDSGTLEVTSNEVGARVEVGGKPVGITPFKDKFPVGSHTVIVSKEGYLAVTPQTVEIKVDQTSSVDFTLEIDPEGVPGGGMGMLTKIGIVTASVGGALLIGGAVTGGLTSGTQSDFDDLLKKGDVTPDDIEEAQKLQDDGEVLALTTTILFAAGGALAAAGVALIIVDLVGVEDNPEDSASNYDFNVFVAPDGAGASFEVRW